MATTTRMPPQRMARRQRTASMVGPKSLNRIGSMNAGTLFWRFKDGAARGRDAGLMQPAPAAA
jgi:hypothetical protein